MYMDVVFNGLYVQQRLYDTQLSDFHNHLPETVAIVGLKATILPRGELYSENYFLLKCRQAVKLKDDYPNRSRKDRIVFIQYLHKLSIEPSTVPN